MAYGGSELVSGYTLNGSEVNNIILDTVKSIECPFCHKGIETQPLVFCRVGPKNIQIFLKCKPCRNTFIGYAEEEGDLDHKYVLQSLSKGNHKITEQAKEIKNISPAFVKIYGEAELAEQENLKEICGVGYRKALEFLVKDFLIGRDASLKDTVEKTSLSDCIKNHIDNPKIKEAALKATWLGNDETHYIKDWDDKDLQDLKTLLSIMIHHIILELQMGSYADMNPKKKSPKKKVSKDEDTRQVYISER